MTTLLTFTFDIILALNNLVRNRLRKTVITMSTEVAIEQNWIKLEPIWFEHRLKILKMGSGRCLFIPRPFTGTVKIFNIESNIFEDTFTIKTPAHKSIQKYMPLLKNAKIYMYTEPEIDDHVYMYKLFEFNMKDKSIEVSLSEFPAGDYPEMVNTGDEIHFICNDSSHLIYNTRNQSVREIEFHSGIGINDYGFLKCLYLESKKCILAFDEHGFAIYSLIKEEWMRLKDCVTPIGMGFGTNAITTFDDKYVFIMGVGKGEDEMDVFGEIYAFDTDENKCKECSIKWPWPEFDNPMFPIMIRDATRDKLLTFGYVNTCFKMKEFKDVQVLPHYLIQLITQWFVMEYAHIFAGYRHDNMNQVHDHYTINVDDLIDSIGEEVVRDDIGIES